MNRTSVHKLVSATGRNEQSGAQQICIREMNRGAAEVARQRLRGNAECIKMGTRGQLMRIAGVSAEDPTVRACFEQGLPRRMSKARTGIERPRRVESRSRIRLLAVGVVTASDITSTTKILQLT